MTALAIDVREIYKHYQDGWFGLRRFTALKGVDLQVPQGEVFGLLGPNGAGKTTLIKILLGIVRLSQGSAQLLGENAGTKSSRVKVGYLPENLTFPAHQTAVRALEFYGRLSRVAESTIQERIPILIEKVGLQGREKELVRKYSKGMRQRLGLAQAMLHSPELFILDEPTDGLDPMGRSQIRQIITDLRSQGKTIFLNSHILQEVELVCDRVGILVGGKLLGMGTPAELTKQFHGAHDTKVRIELAGEEAAFEQLRERTGLVAEILPDGRRQLATQAHAQADVDQLVDKIRSLNISILRLDRSRLTLEEIFLSVVKQNTNSEYPIE